MRKLTESRLRQIIREELNEIVDVEKEIERKLQYNPPKNAREAVDAAVELESWQLEDNTARGEYIPFTEPSDIPKEADRTLNQFMQAAEGRKANRKEKKEFRRRIAKQVRMYNNDAEMYM